MPAHILHRTASGVAHVATPCALPALEEAPAKVSQEPVTQWRQPSPSRLKALTKRVARTSVWALDGAMCGAMFAIQRRHRLHSGSRAELEHYIAENARFSRNEYFSAPPLLNLKSSRKRLQWTSAVETDSLHNDRCHVELFPCAKGWLAPTVLMLHALMSTNDAGYRQRAAAFNAQGWNACFVHLPYHFSRTPPGCFNGELAVTPDLVRTSEGLRQGVSELRQLMGVLRGWGCAEFGLLATSYGGWIGSLLASVERDFRFIALLEPIADIEHAIWRSPAGAAMRRELRRHDIDQSLIAQHFHLTSPMHAEPLCGGERVVMLAGDYDRVTRTEEVSRLHAVWNAAELLHVPQGHFGSRMMPALWEWLNQNGVLAQGIPASRA